MMLWCFPRNGVLTVIHVLVVDLGEGNPRNGIPTWILIRCSKTLQPNRRAICVEGEGQADSQVGQAVLQIHVCMKEALNGSCARTCVLSRFTLPNQNSSQLGKHLARLWLCCERMSWQYPREREICELLSFVAERMCHFDLDVASYETSMFY